GHFALAWKQAHGYGVKVSEDWLEDLLSLPRGKISVPLLPVYRDCILQTALLRAAQNLGQHPDLADEVVSALLDLAYAHQGTFRDEISRSLVAMGSEAMPALIEASAEANAPDRQPALARFILDKMDRLHPRQALAAVQSQPRLLERVLTA